MEENGPYAVIQVINAQIRLCISPVWSGPSSPICRLRGCWRIYRRSEKDLHCWLRLLPCLLLIFGYLLSGLNTNSREATLSKPLCLPSEKGSIYPKRKEFAHKGNNFFPFRIDPFSEGSWYTGKQVGCNKSWLPCKNVETIYQVWQAPLTLPYRIRPNYRTVRLGFSKILGKLAKYILRIHLKLISKGLSNDALKAILLCFFCFFFFFVFFFCCFFFSDFLYKSMCCGYTFELHRQVDAIQMGSHNICLYMYKEVNKKYTGCILKTTELLDCVRL